MLIPYVFAAYFELLFNQSAAHMVSVLISYVVSVLGLALEYLFVSFVEKHYYDDETSNIIKKGIVISGVILLIFMVFFIISQFVNYAIVYNVFNISSPYISLGELLSMSSYLKMNIDCIFITIMLSICFFSVLPQLSSPKIWLAGKITSFVLFAKVIWAYAIKPVYTELFSELLNNNYYTYIQINMVFNEFIEAIYIIVLFISTYLFVKELINNHNVSRILYALPLGLVLYLILYTVTVFAQLSSIMLITFEAVLIIFSIVMCYSALKKIDTKNHIE